MMALTEFLTFTSTNFDITSVMLHTQNAEELPSYVKGRADLVNKTNGTENKTKEAFLVNLDIKLLISR